MVDDRGQMQLELLLPLTALWEVNKPRSIHSFIHSKPTILSNMNYEPITAFPLPISETHRMGTKDLEQDHPTYLKLSQV